MSNLNKHNLYGTFFHCDQSWSIQLIWLKWYFIWHPYKKQQIIFIQNYIVFKIYFLIYIILAY